jgi:isoquinoline 1-oxidoreductase alpha subunit
MAEFTLSINNVDHSVEADPAMPVLWVLRDMLGMTGTKYGCGIGACGACTAHLDGQAVRTCQLPIGDVGAGKLLTIEGLSPDLTHSVQRAWMETDVPQCGYCQAGQIMQAAALLTSTPLPTDEDIDAAMSDNVCRCGTYQRIRQAIKLAAELNAAVRK